MPSLKDEIRDKNLSKLASFRDRTPPASEPAPTPSPPMPTDKSGAGIEDVRKRKPGRPKKVKPADAIVDTSQPVTTDLETEVVESNDHLSNIEKNTTDTNNNLSKLSSQLESKFIGPTAPTTMVNNSTESVIKDFGDKAKPVQDMPAPKVIPAVLPGANKKEKEGTTGGATNPKELKEKAGLEKASHPAMKILSAVKTGFKTVKGVGDKIAGFLFKNALTAAIEAAKIAAIIFLIIAAVDLIRIHFKYWSEKFSEKFEAIKETISGYMERFGAWIDTITPLFSGMFDAIDYVRNVFATGDWGSLAAAIGNVVKEAFKSLGAMIQEGISKLAGAILRKLGFKDTADSIEAIGLENTQNMTNKKLTPEQQEKVAKQQQKMLEKDYTPTQTGITAFLPDKFRKAIGALSDGEYDQIQAEKKDMDKLKGLNNEDQVNTIAATNEARAALNRYESKVKRLDSSDPEQAKKLNDAYNEAKTAIDNPNLSKTPTVKVELNKQLGDLLAKSGAKAPPKAAPASKSAEGVTAASVAQKTADAKAPKADQSTNNTNVNTTMVKNNKTVQMQTPVTSTRAPGVFGGTGVN